MAKLGDLVVRIGANTKGFNAKLGALKSQIRKDTKNIAAMGRNMSMGITAALRNCLPCLGFWLRM